MNPSLGYVQTTHSMRSLSMNWRLHERDARIGMVETPSPIPTSLIARCSFNETLAIVAFKFTSKSRASVSHTRRPKLHRQPVGTRGHAERAYRCDSRTHQNRDMSGCLRSVWPTGTTATSSRQNGSFPRTGTGGCETSFPSGFWRVKVFRRSSLRRRLGSL